jgi:hypothetical protein
VRDLADAQHEAAHVVVGVALGAKVSRVTLAGGGDVLGCVDYLAPREAELLLLAAGVVWERRVGDLEHASYDLAALRRLRVYGQARLVALERAAWAVLSGAAGLHARVTRALLERDLTARDVARLARGEKTVDGA